MNLKYLSLIFQTLCVAGVFAGIPDPVADYLTRSAKGAGYRAEEPFFADDAVRRYDLDLNNDGTKEVVITSGHEGQGKQGYLHYVYSRHLDGYEFVSV